MHIVKPYYENDFGKLYHGDCLEIIPELHKQGVIVDAVITDPPYGTTSCRWDSVIPFDKMWWCIESICRHNRAVVIFGSEPFSSCLRLSNKKGYKYDLVWDKTFGRQPQLSNIQPMKRHENISIFEIKGGRVLYNPQRQKLNKPYKSSGAGNNSGTRNDHGLGLKKQPKEYTHKTPTSVLSFKPESNSVSVHPTQKPLDLIRYLIKTYSNEGDVVLDFTAGSGTLAVAAQNTGRKWICIEQCKEYCDVIVDRIVGIKKYAENSQHTD